MPAWGPTLLRLLDSEVGAVYIVETDKTCRMLCPVQNAVPLQAFMDGAARPKRAMCRPRGRCASTRTTFTFAWPRESQAGRAAPRRLVVVRLVVRSLGFACSEQSLGFACLGGRSGPELLRDTACGQQGPMYRWSSSMERSGQQAPV